MNKFSSLHLVKYTFILAVFMLVIYPATMASAELVDRVVAVVNEDVITLSELDEEGKAVFRKVAASTPAEYLETELTKAREEILETLIDKRLIAQLAATKNIMVSEPEVDNAFARVVERSRLGKKKFIENMVNTGLTEEVYRASLKSQLLMNKLVSSDVRAKIVITEAMIRDHYNDSYTSQVEGGAYYLLQMGFSWQNGDRKPESQAPPYAGKIDAEKRAEQVHALARDGKDFSSLAKEYSDLPSASDGGDIGSFQLDEMADYMRDAVAELKAGDVSGIVETPVGFQFFKLVSLGDGGVVEKAPYDSVKENIKQELFEVEMKKAYSQWVRELKSQAYIQKL